MGSSLKVSDFNISGKDIPEDVADKILEYHLKPLEKVNKTEPLLNASPSLKSSYRPRWWELQMGRDGDSQHCFYGKGATDVTCENFKENKDVLLKTLIENTEYTRFAVYNSFIHCDYAIQDERWVFNSRWVRQYQIDD